MHNRCTNRASLIQKFDKHFREVGRRSGLRFGGEPFSYAFVGSSQQYLTKVHTYSVYSMQGSCHIFNGELMQALLENPALPGELREKVLHGHAESEGESDALVTVK